jgi:hypothetical protein
MNVLKINQTQKMQLNIFEEHQESRSKNEINSEPVEKLKKKIIENKKEILSIATMEYDSKTITKKITEKICSMIAEADGKTSLEKEIGPIAFKTKKGVLKYRSGRVDIFAEFNDGGKLFIEIDRANKKWSHRKLKHLQDMGNNVLWVRWSTMRGFNSEIPCISMDDVCKN